MVGYRERGTGPPLLLLNGMAVSSRAWPEPWLARLERSFRLLLVDNRGTGSSPDPGEAFSMADLARDSAEVLDRCGVDRAHVFGHSMGGMIALTLAMEHPARVDRLLLSATSPGQAMAVPPKPEVRARLAAMLPGSSQPNEAVVGGYRGDHTDASVIVRQLQAMSGFESSRLGDVQAETLVLHGEVDPLVPVENGRRLVSAIPRARLEVLPGVGHLVTAEATDQAAQVVEDFLVTPQL